MGLLILRDSLFEGVFLEGGNFVSELSVNGKSVSERPEEEHPGSNRAPGETNFPLSKSSSNKRKGPSPVSVIEGITLISSVSEIAHLVPSFLV